MNYRIGVSTTFKKDIKHLGKRYPSLVDDYAHLLEELEANPNLERTSEEVCGRSVWPSHPRAEERAAVRGLLRSR